MSYQIQISDLQKDTGGLKERVAKLERTVEFLLNQLNLTYVDIPGEVQFADVIALAHSGNKIGAIKLYREQTNTSLADAQKFVDGL